MHQSDPVLERSALLYERYAPMVLAYLLRRLNSREDAEDVLLEVFTVILEKRSSLPQNENALRVWILGIARHKAVDHYRRSARIPSISLADIEERMYERAEQEPEQAILRREEYRQLQLHIQKLSKPQQEVLHLHFGEGLSCGEIAQIIAKSESAVRTALYRALKRLRRIYRHQRVERSF